MAVTDRQPGEDANLGTPGQPGKSPLRTPGLLLLFGAVLAIALVYAFAIFTGSAPVWGPWVLALAVPASMVATLFISTGNPGGRLAAVFVLTFLLLAGGFVLALALPGDGERLVLGLPRRAAIVLYGVGLLPLFVLPVAHALSKETDDSGDTSNPPVSSGGSDS
jgi:hypothetical protein